MESKSETILLDGVEFADETNGHHFEADFKNPDDGIPEEEIENDDYLNQIFEPVDPADLPTKDEVRQLKREFDENSKFVEDLIKLAKDSKLEKNLLQTIHLKLPETPESSKRRREPLTIASDTFASQAEVSTIPSIEDDEPIITKIPNRHIRMNCLYNGEIAYYNVSSEARRSDSVSYFYRQLKKEQQNSNEDAVDIVRPLEIMDNDFIKQWRLLQKRESDTKLAASMAKEAAAVAAAAAKMMQQDRQKKIDREDYRMEGEDLREGRGANDGRGGGGGDLEPNGLENGARREELASFTLKLGQRILRLQKDAARLTEGPQRSFMQEQGF